MTDDIRKLIVDHSLASPTNTRTALLVGHAYPAIRKELINRTLAELEKRFLSRTEGPWLSDIRRARLEESGGKEEFGLELWRPTWPEGLKISIDREKRDPYTWIGVERPPEELPCAPTLHRALQEGVPSITSIVSNPGWIWSGRPGRMFDWAAPDTVLALAEGEQVREYMNELLVATANIVDRIILDQAVSR